MTKQNPSSESTPKGAGLNVLLLKGAQMSYWVKSLLRESLDQEFDVCVCRAREGGREREGRGEGERE